MPRGSRLSRRAATSAPWIGSPQVVSRRTPSNASPGARSAIQERSSDGVQCTVVADSAASQERSPAVPRRRTSLSRSPAPLNRGIRRASMPAPKLSGNRTPARSSGPKPKTSRPSRAWFTQLRCPCTTPLGRPVDPEVKISTAGSSGSGSGTGVSDDGSAAISCGLSDRAPESSRMCARRSSGRNGSRGDHRVAGAQHSERSPPPRELRERRSPRRSPARVPRNALRPH